MLRHNRWIHDSEQTGNTGHPLRIRWVRIGACLAMSTVLTGTVFIGQDVSPNQVFHLPPDAYPVPDYNARMEMKASRLKRQNYEAANAERKKQMADASDKLLILARDLKDEMDKAATGKIPDRAVREAEVIEMLAHNVQENMKFTVGSN